MKEALQAHCHWCNESIYTESVYKVNCFWNHGYEGYPICEWCSDGLKTNGKPHKDKLRKELGLAPIRERITIERWL